MQGEVEGVNRDGGNLRGRRVLVTRRVDDK